METIKIPLGYEIDKTKSTEDTIVLNKIKIVDVDADFERAFKIAKELGDFYNIDGFDMSDDFVDACVPSEEEAEAVNALCKLMFLRNEINEDWEIDWKDDYQSKWVIHNKNGVLVSEWTTVKLTKPLVFRSEKVCNQFLKDYRELLETAKPLL
nr:MAG TPA: hypothetical protein [Bacteriophage sp.]